MPVLCVVQIGIESFYLDVPRWPQYSHPGFQEVLKTGTGRLDGGADAPVAGRNPDHEEDKERLVILYKAIDKLSRPPMQRYWSHFYHLSSH